MREEKRDFLIIINEADSGRRLDTVIAKHVPDCSRSFAATLIRNNKIKIKGAAKKPGYRLKQGDEIMGHMPMPVPTSFEPQPIPIDVLYNDEDIIVINKHAGLVVHPAPGHNTGTLVNALLYHCPDLKNVGCEIRPGIVHRLDKDTSGAIVVAKNNHAHIHLSFQFKSRKIVKTYLAVIHGKIDGQAGIVELPIGRHPTDRKRMSANSRNGRGAVTAWSVRKRLQGATLIGVNLQTGRTHQIRVHCAAIHHPVIGDSVYGPRKMQKNISEIIKSVSRQMLHAWRLELTHPGTGKRMLFEAPVPDDMLQLIDSLKL